jgi:outer membrane lipoprotein-sorting protein
MSFAKWSCVGLMALALTGVVRADAVEEVEKKLIEAHSKLKSYTSKTKTVQNFDMPGGNKMSSDYGGTVEWKRDGEKQMFRTEMKGTTNQSMAGKDNKMDVSVLMVSDGEFLYTLSEQKPADAPGQKMATKQKPDSAMTGDPKKLFEKIHSDNTINMLPEEKVDGVSSIVFEVIPKNTAEGPVAKSVMYFAKDTGINVKVVGKDKEGKDVFTNTSTDIKVNADIPNDRFVFKAPEGVQVMDMTGATP